MYDLNCNIGTLPCGELNLITDVDGVSVGHCTLCGGGLNTGVTVVMPCKDNPFLNKLTAASFVMNGFGKTQGLVQIDELGTLETPIALTNTLNVGLVHDALTEYMIDICNKSGKRLTSVNPVVCECNDASLNDIQRRAVKKEHVFSAINAAGKSFDLGDVGCGKGTTCHGLKGGVGSASRIMEIDGKKYTLGALVQTNHGRLNDLIVNGDPIGARLNAHINSSVPDKGSCIVIIATDLPVNSRQLKRIIKRAAAGLARLGSFFGSGSGDVFVGFGTHNRFCGGQAVTFSEVLNEDLLDLPFRACCEATEEAVLKSLLCAHSVTGQGGITRLSLNELLAEL